MVLVNLNFTPSEKQKVRVQREGALPFQLETESCDWAPRELQEKEIEKLDNFVKSLLLHWILISTQCRDS